ncbi:MAG TPA: hypothetical protein VK280_23865 [Streptosporangiaceae bacterium]|nr:hypothetical protein [Streptosporangiaceae bacterium]
MNGRRGEEDLAVLIERSAELKRDLVDFACSPRWERSLAAAMLEAGLEEIDEGDAISAIDRFTGASPVRACRSSATACWSSPSAAVGKGAKRRLAGAALRDNDRLWSCTATNGCARARP